MLSGSLSVDGRKADGCFEVFRGIFALAKYVFLVLDVPISMSVLFAFSNWIYNYFDCFFLCFYSYLVKRVGHEAINNLHSNAAVDI